MKRPPGVDALGRQRELRKFSTEAEKRLWSRLRGRKVGGCKFRRQVWLGSFIVDFVCLERRLIIEADGGQHAEQEAYDERRTRFLNREGYRVLRFWNNEVLSNLDGVVTLIEEALRPSPSHPATPGGPLPLPCRERGS